MIDQIEFVLLVDLCLAFFYKTRRSTGIVESGGCSRNECRISDNDDDDSSDDVIGVERAIDDNDERDQCNIDDIDDDDDSGNEQHCCHCSNDDDDDDDASDIDDVDDWRRYDNERAYIVRTSSMLALFKIHGDILHVIVVRRTPM
jgi:hypothetical protein